VIYKYHSPFYFEAPGENADEIWKKVKFPLASDYEPMELSITDDRGKRRMWFKDRANTMNPELCEYHSRDTLIDYIKYHIK